MFQPELWPSCKGTTKKLWRSNCFRTKLV